jgi:hypothetical protein
LTELEDETDEDVHMQLDQIMHAASKELSEDCACVGFLFITCRSKGRKKTYDPKRNDETTIECCGLLSDCGLEYSKSPGCAGTYSVSYDRTQYCGFLRVDPKRKIGTARHKAKDGSVTFVVEAGGQSRDETVSSTGRDLEGGARRAARMVPAPPALPLPLDDS